MLWRSLLALIVAAHVALPTRAHAAEVTLSSMISAIQLALLDAQVALDDNQMLPLSTVEVELNVVNRLEVDGRVGFWIVKLGAVRENSVTSNVRMVLTPPSADAAESTSAADELIRSVLASAIFEGAAARCFAMGGQPPLEATAFVIMLEFALVESANGEVSVAVPPIDTGAGGTVSGSELQRITLIFGA
ncbi:trypco2 family protein [Salipiger sp. PrR003]|uniref:trypco2 family protein n=1 Tax=Salipiger sp. PrR003 TaxID=2706776 RepID=UPI0013DA001F|nr:trypco2 family protein [Salipiger sp. PrR003]NDV50657.1 hypothetical protein [Salipiger sp. PrR003]